MLHNVSIYTFWVFNFEKYVYREMYNKKRKMNYEKSIIFYNNLTTSIDEGCYPKHFSNAPVNINCAASAVSAYPSNINCSSAETISTEYGNFFKMPSLTLLIAFCSSSSHSSPNNCSLLAILHKSDCLGGIFMAALKSDAEAV